MDTPKLKTTWTKEEDQITFDLMSRSIKRGNSINAAAKVASEVLEEQGFKRNPAACSFRWHHVLKKNNEIVNESPKEEPQFLTAVPMEELPEIPVNTTPLEIVIDQEDSLDSPIDLSLDYIRTYCARLQEENKALKEEVESLQEVKNRYDNLKELLTQYA